MNTLTRTEMVNVALRRARKAPIRDIEDATSDQAIDARLYFKKCYQKLLSSYPWPFATVRESLQRSTETPPRGYSNLFDLPQNALYIWDIYNDPSQYTVYGSIWNYRTYSYFSFDASNDASFFENIGEIIGRRIATHFRRLDALYTQKRDIPPQEWSIPFAEAMMSEMRLLFEEETITDPDMARVKIAQTEQERNRAAHRSALQNRKAQTPAKAQIIQFVDQFMIR